MIVAAADEATTERSRHVVTVECITPMLLTLEQRIAMMKREAMSAAAATTPLPACSRIVVTVECTPLPLLWLGQPITMMGTR